MNSSEEWHKSVRAIITRRKTELGIESWAEFDRRAGFKSKPSRFTEIMGRGAIRPHEIVAIARAIEVPVEILLGLEGTTLVIPNTITFQCQIRAEDLENILVPRIVEYIKAKLN